MTDYCCIILPFPPSLNNLFANRVRGGRFPTKRYKAWQEAAQEAIRRQRSAISTYSSPVSLTLAYGAPTKAKRDLDNFAKAVIDSLVKAGILEDDHLVHRLLMYWSTEVENGVRIEIMPMGAQG